MWLFIICGNGGYVMKKVLMNKNTEVLLADYYSATGGFISVDEIYKCSLYLKKLE